MSRVLLVNDSRFESMVMKDMLGSMGYNVIISDENNAAAQVGTFSPDYVVVNYIMKKYRGDQLAAIIKIQNPDVKCILSSNNPVTLDRFSSRNVDAVLLTPTDRQRLKLAFDKADSRR